MGFELTTYVSLAKNLSLKEMVNIYPESAHTSYRHFPKHSLEHRAPWPHTVRHFGNINGNHWPQWYRFLDRSWDHESCHCFTSMMFGVLSVLPSRPLSTALNLSINLQLNSQKTRRWKWEVFKGQVEDDDDDNNDRDDVHRTWKRRQINTSQPRDATQRYDRGVLQVRSLPVAQVPKSGPGEPFCHSKQIFSCENETAKRKKVKINK